ncbi:AraC family transcriptional regulator [Tsukamurella tyrosinosolvens]|uniref:AraC family transcriptional regulator n=1 Tax=Tsukamurella tyrosinosolvens TaxID=57704 RepID=UPI00079A7A60|nr:AraC family transcriptional regulator [Tsukamurella tyrosinosolvens]KXP04855.1 hypothetical protein AXK59_15945 [Tsukamurella tyrosinosolvens]
MQSGDVLGSVLAPLRLQGAYHSDWRLHPGWAIQGHPEPRALIHYVLAGTVVVTCTDGKPHVLAAGDLAMFPRGAAHIVACTSTQAAPFIHEVLPDRRPGDSAILELGDTSAPAIGRMLCAGLDYDLTAEQMLYRLLPDVLVVDRTSLEQQPLLHHLLEGILVEANHPSAGSETINLRAFELAYVLGLRLALGATDTCLARAIRNPRVGKALAAISDRFSEPWTVSSLAAHSGVSGSTLAREFMTTIETTPAAYLRSRRILEARRLLRESGHPLDYIATAIGYTSTVGFHQAFVRECGETPGAFRRRH